jgi:hypothetical protein
MLHLQYWSYRLCSLERSSLFHTTVNQISLKNKSSSSLHKNKIYVVLLWVRTHFTSTNITVSFNSLGKFLFWILDSLTPLTAYLASHYMLIHAFSQSVDLHIEIDFEYSQHLFVLLGFQNHLCSLVPSQIREQHYQMKQIYKPNFNYKICK